MAPEKWWLEDDPFLLGFGNFSGAMLNFGRVLAGTFSEGSEGTTERTEVSIKSNPFTIIGASDERSYSQGFERSAHLRFQQV